MKSPIKMVIFNNIIIYFKKIIKKLNLKLLKYNQWKINFKKLLQL